MAFLTQYRIYKWVVMTMGVSNTPVTFMQTMNNLIMDILDKGVIVFLNGILIYSNMVEDCLELLKNVFINLH